MVERIRKDASAEGARVAVFDFDGTISLIRSGWQDVMIPMMVEFLAGTGTDESEEELAAVVKDFVDRLTGRQTMYQMIELAEQIAKRGGKPDDPLVYKRIYLDRLHSRISDRLEELRSGNADPVKYHVPGSLALLDALKDRGFTMYLASGTDQVYLREEARLLGVYDYFDGGVFGALDDYKSFSKKILIQGIIRDSKFKGEEFLGFGDGYVEIENVKEVGGCAVGIATEEPECRKVDEWKRERLVNVGADSSCPISRISTPS